MTDIEIMQKLKSFCTNELMYVYLNKETHAYSFWSSEARNLQQLIILDECWRKWDVV